MGFFVLLLVLLSFIGYGVYGFVNYYSTNKKHDAIIATIIDNPINFQLYRVKIQPQPLATNSVDVIKTSQGKFDFFAEINNPDKRWFIEKITYQFTSGSFSTPVYEDFVLPNETKYFFSLSQTPGSSVNTVSLKIIDIKQKRVPEPEITDKDILIENIEFIPAGGNKLSLPHVKFQVTNNTIYDFWEVPFQIIIFGRSAPIGVNIASLTQFKSGDTREVEVFWFDDIRFSVSEVAVLPDVNFYDKENFMPSELTPGELK